MGECPSEVPTPAPAQVTDVLIKAAYLINVPIMKRHLGGVTLSFKNHFGSVAYPYLLHAEKAIWDMSDDYLIYAAAVGLGTYERGDPWGSGYNQIDYLRIEL